MKEMALMVIIGMMIMRMRGHLLMRRIRKEKKEKATGDNRQQGDRELQPVSLTMFSKSSCPFLLLFRLAHFNKPTDHHFKNET